MLPGRRGGGAAAGDLRVGPVWRRGASTEDLGVRWGLVTVQRDLVYLVCLRVPHVDHVVDGHDDGVRPSEQVSDAVLAVGSRGVLGCGRRCLVLPGTREGPPAAVHQDEQQHDDHDDEGEECLRGGRVVHGP